MFKNVGKKLFLLILFLSLLLIEMPIIWAAETGAIEGKVVDDSGKPLGGVTITASSPSLIGQRTTQTTANGKFRFPILPVGKYTLTFELTGYAPLKKKNVYVRLGQTTLMEIIMKSTAVKEEIVVEAAAPLIEKKTADLSTRITSEELESIPSTARSFRDLAKFVGGVTGVRINTVDGKGEGYPSIRGEGQYGNNYLIDGLSVRDPAVKTTGTPLNYDAIKEVQIITDGFSPEYGQALGGIINVITKSGGNTFDGEVSVLYESDALAGKEKNSEWASTRDFVDWRPYFNIGGPIIRDKLWFFTSFNYFDTINKYPTKTVDKYVIEGADQKSLAQNFFGKLTLGINPNNTLSLSSTIMSSSIDNRGIDELRTKEARGELTTDQKRIRLNYKSLIGSNLVLEFKYGWIDRILEDKPMSGDKGEAQHRDITTGVKWGNYDSFDKNERGRNDLLLESTYFLDDFLGSHEFKGGILYYKTSSSRDLTFTGHDYDLFPDTMPGGAEFLWKGDTPYRYYDYSGAKVKNETKGFGFYLQDRWSPIEPLNIMFGFRVDSQNVYNDVGEKLFDFSFGDTIAPRLTIAWDVTKDGKNIVKLGAGRFYDVVSTSLAEWGNTHNPYSFSLYQWGGPDHPTRDEWMDPNNWGTWDDRDGDGEDEFYPGEPYWTQDPEANPLYYDPNLKPYHKDEILIEYDRAFGTKYAAKLRFVRGWTRDLIEDVAFSIDDWRIINFDRKRRDYNAYEFEFLGQPSNDLFFKFSYVNSAAKGTNPGQFERGGYQSSWGSSNTVGVFGDRPPRDPNHDGVVDDEEAFWNDLFYGLGGLDGDDGWYGYLPYSVDHQIIFNAVYNAPYDILLGVAFEWNSGYHWQKRGFQEAYGGYLTFPEGRGTRTLPSIYWLDISIAKKFKIYKDTYMALRLDVFNVTNNDQPIAMWEEDNEGFGKVLKRQDPRSARLSITFGF